ncbi:lectin-like [Protopterus annectens]|uniref:lectin-like n=1 Tax=Protopterus annectens TaxID=7888 RepID=UPI001CFA6C7B|nr:lectin-like [Protopterus annectens]
MKTLFVFLALIVAVQSSTIELDSENGEETVESESSGIHQHRPKFLMKMVALNETGSFSMKLEGTTYTFYSNPKTFDEAEKQCKRLHKRGHLASIHSHRSNTVLLSVVKRVTSSGEEVWIGGKRNRFHRHFHWTDGTKWDYTYWHRGSPAHYWWSVSCVVVRTKDPGYWHDTYCSHNRGYICEF